MKEKDASNKRVNTRLILVFSLILLAFICLYCIVLQPLYISLSSDVLYMDGWGLTFLDLGINVLELFIILIELAFLVYAAYTYEIKPSLWFLLVGVVATFIKYLADLLVSSKMSGEPIGVDFGYAILYFFLESLLLCALMVFFTAVMSRHRRIRKVYEEGLRAMGGSTDNPKDPVLPYARFFDKTNPVQWNCFVAALVMASIRVLSRLVLDFTIGMPQDAFEWFSVFFYYFLDILILPVGYLFLEYVVLELFVQAEKRNHFK